MLQQRVPVKVLAKVPNSNLLGKGAVSMGGLQRALTDLYFLTPMDKKST
jgi:hypothetical protein